MLYIANTVSADYIRQSIGEIQSIEPREWDVDRLWANLNLVAGAKNLTQYYVIDKYPRGNNTTYENMFKDITISGSEPDLTLSYALYNVGDGDPQKVGLSKYSILSCSNHTQELGS